MHNLFYLQHYQITTGKLYLNRGYFRKMLSYFPTILSHTYIVILDINVYCGTDVNRLNKRSRTSVAVEGVVSYYRHKAIFYWHRRCFMRCPALQHQAPRQEHNLAWTEPLIKGRLPSLSSSTPHNHCPARFYCSVLPQAPPRLRNSLYSPGPFRCD